MSTQPRLPDFIIGGAMKSGTTTLHHLLAAHPGVFIPEAELFFFDLDEFEQHRSFFVPFGSPLRVPDYHQDFDHNLARYRRFFRHARPGQLVGEDTTTYLASRKAPARIAGLLPEVKLIFVLRDPVERAWSQYWHMVASGSMLYPFEQMLRRDPATILQRGHYREQLTRYLERFDRSRILILLFEAMLKDLQGTLDRVGDFLGLEDRLAVSGLQTHQNRTLPPRSLPLQLAVNRLASIADSRRYLGHLEGTPRPGGLGPLVRRAYQKVAFHRRRPLRPMPDGIRRFLEDYYRMENRGLLGLIGEEKLPEHWPWMGGPDSSTTPW